MSPFLILHNDLRKNNGRSNMTYGRWHCGKTLALNQTHSGMLQLKCLGVLHMCVATIANCFAPHTSCSLRKITRLCDAQQCANSHVTFGILNMLVALRICI